MANPKATILVTGHSLGGAIAQVVAQIFGFSGSTIDPVGAARAMSNPEFSILANDMVQKTTGIGIASDFTDYVVINSLASGSTGAQLGQVNYLSGQQTSNWSMLKSALLALANPAIGISYAVITDQFGNLHSSSVIVRTMQMLDASKAYDALTGGNIFGSGYTLVPETISRFDPNTGLATEVPVLGSVLVKAADGSVTGVLRMTGTGIEQKLEVFSPSGKVYEVKDPIVAQAIDATSINDAVIDLTLQKFTVASGGVTSEIMCSKGDSRFDTSTSVDISGNSLTTNFTYNAAKDSQLESPRISWRPVS